MSELHQLLNNGAFWTFLGTITVAYFGYKVALVPYLKDQKRKKIINGDIDSRVPPMPHLNVKKVSSFDELKEVVGVLQKELERKDKVMQEQDIRYREELMRAYGRIDDLYQELDKVKQRLSRARIGE